MTAREHTLEFFGAYEPLGQATHGVVGLLSVSAVFAAHDAVAAGDGDAGAGAGTGAGADWG